MRFAWKRFDYYISKNKCKGDACHRPFFSRGKSLINRPERQLLLLCAYISPNPQVSDAAKQIIQSNPQWSETLSLANRWQVEAYLFHFINSQNLKKFVPESFWQSLQENYQRQAMQTLLLKRQIQDLNHHFTQNNIPYCLIKGAETINTIYADMPIRSMSDIDILCYPKDIDTIVKTLTQLGYFQKTMHQSNELQSIATYRKHFPAFFHNKRHTIEVHFNLFPGAHNQKDITQEIWAHAAPIDHSSQFRMDVYHHLLYLCHHLAYHIQSPREGLVLYWFFDIYHWLKQYQISIDCPLFQSLNQDDRQRIEFIHHIIHNQWIKPEGLNHSFINRDPSLAHILDHHLKEKRIDRKKRVLSYYWQVWCDKNPQWSYSEQLLYWFRLFFPQFSYLKDRYHVRHNWALPLYCIGHPFIIIFRAIKRLMY